MRIAPTPIGVAAVLVLLPMGMADQAGENPTSVETPATLRTVMIDSREIASRVESGMPVTLPTMWGEVELTTFERVSSGIQVYRTGPDGGLVDDGLFVPSVWNAASADHSVTGILLADGHQVRATLATPDGRSTLEPGLDGFPSDGVDVLHRMYSDEPTPAVLAEWEAPPELSDAPAAAGPSTMTVSRTMVAYVDDEFVGVWGSAWPNHVGYLTTWLNTYLDDVGLTYSVTATVNSDPGTTSNSPWSDGYEWMKAQSYLGRHTKVFWSHVDYDGCTIGQAAMPGTYAMLQTADDACHLWALVDTDFERAYFMAHELGHNNNGAHAPECNDCAWSHTPWGGHTHREILYQGANGHLHECWGSTNANRMATYLGTSFVGTACS